MITYKLYTNQGNRENNEDSIGMKERNGCYCFSVADGLGGHGQGEVASALVVEAIMKAEAWMPENEMAKAINNAQTSLVSKRKELHCINGMLTTVTMLAIDEHCFCWGHVGDSRVYYFSNGKIKKRTMDHSVPQKLVMQGRIKETEIRKHPDRSRLLRAMGMEWNGPKYEISKVYKRRKWRKDAFLLCSDGFWELIEEKQMEFLLKKAKNVEEWIETMVEIVKENGKGTNMDNFSVIGVFADGKNSN